MTAHYDYQIPGRQVATLVLSLLVSMATALNSYAAGDELTAPGDSEITIERVLDSKRENGWIAGFEFGLAESLEIGIAAESVRDRSEIPAGEVTAGQITLQWWPITINPGTSVGTELTFQREHERGSDGEVDTRREWSAALITKWRRDRYSAQWQLTRIHEKSRQGSALQWSNAIGFGVDINEQLELELEVEKSPGESTVSELSIEYEWVDDINLITSIGRLGTTTFGTFGLKIGF